MQHTAEGGGYTHVVSRLARNGAGAGIWGSATRPAGGEGQTGQGAGQVLRVWGCLKLGHVLPGPGLEALPWSTGDVCRGQGLGGHGEG